MSYCPRCGALITPNDNFCGSCAAPLAKGGAGQPSPQGPGTPMGQQGAPPAGQPYAPQPQGGAPGAQPYAPPPYDANEATPYAPERGPMAGAAQAAGGAAYAVAAGADAAAQNVFQPAPQQGYPGGPAPQQGLGPSGPSQIAFASTASPAAFNPPPPAPSPYAAPAQQQPALLFGSPQQQPPAYAPAPPYGPPPSPPEAQPTGRKASRCEYGHDVAAGSSYCNFGHPIALGEMQFAGGDAFGPTFAPAETPAEPTGQMSPFPAAGQAAQPPGYAYSPPGVQPGPAGAGWPGQQPEPQPVPQPQGALAPQPQGQGQQAEPQQGAVGWPAAAVQPAPAVEAAVDAGAQARRQLRGFLYSFHGDPAGVFWPLFMGRNVLGRAGSGEVLDVEIADPTTSSRHAVVICDQSGGITLEDEGSTNGSFVNDNAVGYRGRIELQDGDHVRFGAYNAGIRLVTR